MTDPTRQLLFAEGLGLEFPGRPVLRNFNLAVGGGEVLGLSGPNGAGKTSFIRACLGLAKPSEGRLLVDGRVVGTAAHRRALAGVGYLPQREVSGKIPCTVRVAVSMGRYGRVGLGRALSTADWAVVDSLLDRMELSRFAHREFSELSGGERQRVLLARSLAAEPDLLFLDEPTTYLEGGVRLKLVQRALEDVLGRGGAVILVSHEKEVLALSTRIARLSHGALVPRGRGRV